MQFRWRRIRRGDLTHPLVLRQKLVDCARTSSAVSCSQRSKFHSHLERRGVGGGEEKERPKFGGEMTQVRWIILRGELTDPLVLCQKWPIAPILRRPTKLKIPLLDTTVDFFCLYSLPLDIRPSGECHHVNIRSPNDGNLLQNVRRR